MSNRTIQKRIRMGYVLHINRTGAKGAWERLGPLFTTSLEGSQYREKHAPGVERWRVQAVRVSAEKVGVEPAEAKLAGRVTVKRAS